MRTTALFGIVGAAALLPLQPASAEVEGAWCLSLGEGGDRCVFASFEACRAEMRKSTSAI